MIYHLPDLLQFHLQLRRGHTCVACYCQWISLCLSSLSAPYPSPPQSLPSPTHPPFSPPSRPVVPWSLLLSLIPFLLPPAPPARGLSL